MQRGGAGSSSISRTKVDEARIPLRIVATSFETGSSVLASGQEHVPRNDPAVLTANHVGYLDFAFVGAAARHQKRLVRFMAKKEVFDHKVSGPLMRGMKQVPVERFGRARDAIDAAVAAVAAMGRGEVIGMFPEATISRSFIPREGKSGAACMAMEAGGSEELAEVPNVVTSPSTSGRTNAKAVLHRGRR